MSAQPLGRLVRAAAHLLPCPPVSGEESAERRLHATRPLALHASTYPLADFRELGLLVSCFIRQVVTCRRSRRSVGPRWGSPRSGVPEALRALSSRLPRSF